MQGNTLPAYLAGLRIAVTRAGERGTPLADALRRVGATVHEIPLTRIETLELAPLRAAVARLADYDWILLTSVNAVEHLARVVAEHGARAAMATRRLAVVGTATAAACDAHGWRAPTVQPDKAQAEGMLDVMAARSDIDGARMLYPAAAGARDVLPEGLRALGAAIDVVPVYRSAPDPEGQARLRALAASGELDLVTVAAPSAVTGPMHATGSRPAYSGGRASSSESTARAARVAGFPVKLESTAATMEGWVKAIVAAYAPPGGAPPVTVAPPSA